MDDPGWQELERMARAADAADAQMASEFPSAETIERWKKLFGYHKMEAVALIGEQRGDGKQINYIHPQFFCIVTRTKLRVCSHARAHLR